MIVVEIRDLNVVYGRNPGVTVERLTLTSGRVNCVVGPNGAGKSSLLKAVAGLLTYRGEVSIRINDVEVEKNELHRYVSYVSDIQPSSIKVSVREALLYARYPCSPGFFYSDRDFKYVEETSRLLGISHLMEKSLSELSSGELQRVLIAIGIVKNPALLLLDEPDIHLDLYNKTRLIKVIRGLAGEKLVFLSTHDPSVASTLCDRLILLNNGRMQGDFGIEELNQALGLFEEVFKTRLALVEVEGRRMLIPVYSVST
ncbi:MAG: ABC transporter ATP-binding protein [Thermogladius sp.]|nr:ABC transporter ATP-binding protein [Thermogladius sp.]